MLRRAALACCLALLTACDSGKDGVADSAWHRKDLDAHLARWLAVAPTPSGLMQAQFDRGWHATNAGGDLTLHSRLVYVMAIGFEASGDQRYLAAARKGADFLLEHFRDPQYGGFFHRVDAEGKVLAAHKNTYGHAFALLALSHLARVSGEPKYKAAALQAWRDIRSGLREEQGGLRPEAPRDFAPGRGNHTQNPLMHMFEALLALIEATGDASAVDDARALGDFVLYRLLVGLPDGGAYIPEWYDADWKPLAGEDGYIDLGHQFEWSHLLRTAEKRGLPPLYAEVAERLLKYAVAQGYDEQDGGIFNRVHASGKVDRSKLWWQQAEGMRAFLAAGARPEMARRYRETLALVDQEFLDRDNGGWYLGSKRSCGIDHCGNSQPDPYHLVGLDWMALSTQR